MEVTFLVAIDIPDLSQLTATAAEIESDLSDSGHEVLSVHPWARPNLPKASPAGGFTSLSDPNTTF